MDKKQAKLKKVTTIVFIVVTCVVAVLILLRGLIPLFNLGFKSLGEYENRIVILGNICFSFVIVLSTLLFFKHIKFESSQLLGIVNLIVLVILALIFALGSGKKIDGVVARLVFTALYALFSSIGFFSNKSMRNNFLACVPFLGIMWINYFLFSTYKSMYKIDIVFLCLIFVYCVCEALAYIYASKWYCENCGSENDDKHLFCTKCGTKNPYLK